MYIDNFREVVNTSTLNIPQRLKRIDPGYFLVRNHQTSEWEVHHKEQVDNTFCLSIPYDELDERTLKRVKETRIEYIDKIIAEMEKNNEAIEKENDRKLKDYTETACKDIYKYVTAHESKETIDSNSYFKGVF